MEYLIALIVALFGGIFYFKTKADKAETKSKISENKGRDRELAEQQAFIEQAILDLDKGIEKMNKERHTEKNEYVSKTLKERAEEAKNRYKK